MVIKEKIKAVIFDFDGVIHDTFEIVYKINKQLNPGLTREEYRCFFDGNLYKHPKITPEQSKIYFELQKKEFAFLKIEEEVKKELLKLRKNFYLYIITSNIERDLKVFFENSGIHGMFREILGFESHKSKEEKFRNLMKKHKLNVNNCIFITDTLGDILEANKIGIRTIAVDFGYHEREKLKKGKPYKIISNFHDILPELTKLNK